MRIFDVELADADDYAGASLTLVRHDGTNADDSFGFGNSALFTVSGNELQADGQTFATFGNNGIEGMLVIAFTSSGTPATQALVDDVLQHIIYSNISANPPASVQIDWLFSDGDAAKPQAANGSTTVSITPINSDNNAPQAAPVDLGHAGEDSSAITITAEQLPAGASDADGDTLHITTLSLIHSSQGQLTANADSSWTFVPAANLNGNVAFDYTVSDGALSASSSASLTLDPINDAPVVQPVALGHANEDATASRSRPRNCWPAPAMSTAMRCIPPL
ncbi:cadherin-like domain-containing protein [Methylomicrobium lacus]|uniref:cadherin-like domain-containing protein n=1 Tax=Methylomicrobium lacus TaxID=136992 RepID=UPI0035A847B1